MKKTLLVGLVVSSLALSAHAAPGFYIGAGAGIGGMDTKKADVSGVSTKLRSGVAYRASLGYLMGEGNLNYGAELGYTGYPDNTYSGYGVKVDVSGRTVDLLGVGKYNFSETDTGFFLVGKAGAAVVSQKTTVKGFGPTYSKSKTAVKPELAVGAGYNVNKNVALDVTLAHVFGTNSATSASEIASVNTLMAGVSYNFS